MSLYTLQKIEPKNVIMDDAEIGALPKFAQEIIRHQRALEALCSAPVVSFRDAQNGFDRRRMLARSAHKQWVNVDLPPTR